MTNTQKLLGQMLVVKYGGNAMSNPEAVDAVMRDIVALKNEGATVVVVHGGGPDINQAMKRFGKEPNFINGLRVTDAETMEIVEMVLSGKTNRNLVQRLGLAGAQAVGLSGKDANLFVAAKETEQGDLGFVGRIVNVNPAIVHTLTSAGYIPVISSIAVGEKGETYNVNADTAAGELACALNADRLILMTDVAGFYLDFSDKSSLVATLRLAEARRLIDNNKIERGMLPKIKACLTALSGEKTEAHIIDGRETGMLAQALLSNESVGTKVIK